jgi:hypothetical protein
MMAAIQRSSMRRSSADSKLCKRSFHRWKRWRGQAPVLMIFEGAHWSDPTSLEAFGLVIDRIAGLRVLLLVTLRPEFAPPWVGQPFVSSRQFSHANGIALQNVDAVSIRAESNTRLLH